MIVAFQYFSRGAMLNFLFIVNLIRGKKSNNEYVSTNLFLFNLKNEDY